MVDGVLFPTETTFIVRFNPIFEKFSLCNDSSMNKITCFSLPKAMSLHSAPLSNFESLSLFIIIAQSTIEILSNDDGDAKDNA